MFSSTIGTPGCTDPLASNFDASATTDDGSCVYAVTFNVDMNCEPAGSFTTPNLESPVLDGVVVVYLLLFLMETVYGL